MKPKLGFETLPRVVRSTRRPAGSDLLGVPASGMPFEGGGRIVCEGSAHLPLTLGFYRQGTLILSCMDLHTMLRNPRQASTRVGGCH